MKSKEYLYLFYYPKYKKDFFNFRKRLIKNLYLKKNKEALEFFINKDKNNLVIILGIIRNNFNYEYFEYILKLVKENWDKFNQKKTYISFYYKLLFVNSYFNNKDNIDVIKFLNDFENIDFNYGYIYVNSLINAKIIDNKLLNKEILDYYKNKMNNIDYIKIKKRLKMFGKEEIFDYI